MVFKTLPTTLRPRAARGWYGVLLYALLPLLTLNCFTSEKSLPGVKGAGQISGKVVGLDGTGLPNVTITTSYNGEVLQLTSATNGTFTFKVGEVERGQGFNIQFQKTNFENASAAAVVSLPNLKVDVGNVVMHIVGGTEVTKRTIKGRVIDNFSYRPLSGANVYTIDSAGLAVVAATNEQGEFFLESNYYALDSSFVVSVSKSNYIPRSDLTVTVTAEMNNLTGNGVRLYNKFGFIYGYVANDSITDTDVSKPISLDGATVKLINGNNQELTCTSSGAYDPQPLQAGKYCPDMTGITSPMSLETDAPNPAGRTNDSGGFKFQSEFLFIGTQYAVSVSKTNPNCTSRSSSASDCYRSTTTTADVAATATDNAITGGIVSLKWDAWIYGRVRIKDLATPSASQPHTVCSGTWSSAQICDGANVTVKLYNSSNTYITQTVTDSTGNFVFDTPLITRGTTYRLTFERSNAYSRLIGFSNQGASPNTKYQTPKSLTIPTVPHAPVLAADPVTEANAGPGPNRLPTFSSAEVAEDCGAGMVCMTALPPPSLCVVGTVTDYWNGAGVEGATVAIFDGGWRTATTDTNGKFIIESEFDNPAVNQYPVEISKPGYTGETLVDKQTFSFTHNAVPVANCTTNPAQQFNLNEVTNLNPITATNNAGACDAASVGPTGVSCTPKLKLYPIGVFASVGIQKRFTSQVKQTYEKFLTEKTGLTISARTQPLIHTSGALKDQDAEAFYLHFDDTPRQLPVVPEGKWANHVPVNQMPTTCNLGPNNGPFCSPDVNGVLVEGIGSDVRVIPWQLKTFVYYYFYIAKPTTSGQNYTIETTGLTDTFITLYAQSGALVGTDDDAGDDNNGRLIKGLSKGWYYLKVQGKTNNVFGFFNVRVNGPAATEDDYAFMHSPITGTSPPYQTVNGSSTYGTTCASDNGNLVLSWYDKVGHVLYIAAPGENGGCSASATIEKHGPIGNIIRGRFDGTLRRIAASGSNAVISTSPKGFFNIIRQE